MLSLVRQWFYRRAVGKRESERQAAQERERQQHERQQQEDHRRWCAQYADWLLNISSFQVLTPAEAALFLRLDEARLSEARAYGLRAIEVGGEIRFQRDSLDRFLAGRPPSYYELPELLTVEEAASYLRVRVAVLQAEVEAGRVAAVTVAGELRIERSRLQTLPPYQPQPTPLTPSPESPGTPTPEEPRIERRRRRSEPGCQTPNSPDQSHEPRQPGTPSERGPKHSTLWKRLICGEALPCQRCAYLSGDRWLPCAVRPSGPDGADCPDFLPKVEGRDCA